MRSKYAFVVLLIGVIFALSAAPAAAQGKTSGSIRGVVTDPDGLVTPGVTVIAISEALIGGRQATSDQAQGVYRFPSLPPGNYQFEAALPGFQTFLQDRTFEDWARPGHRIQPPARKPRNGGRNRRCGRYGAGQYRFQQLRFQHGRGIYRTAAGVPEPDRLMNLRQESKTTRPMARRRALRTPTTSMALTFPTPSWVPMGVAEHGLGPGGSGRRVLAQTPSTVVSPAPWSISLRNREATNFTATCAPTTRAEPELGQRTARNRGNEQGSTRISI